MSTETTETTEVRYGNVYKVTWQVRQTGILDIEVGDEILEEAAWSSHGMKDAEWSRVTSKEDLWDLYGNDPVTSRRRLSSRRVY